VTTDEELQVLGLGPNASKLDVKQAYRDLARVWHPDRFQSDARLRALASEKLKEINIAHETLAAYEPRATPHRPAQSASPPPPRETRARPAADAPRGAPTPTPDKTPYKPHLSAWVRSYVAILGAALVIRLAASLTTETTGGRSNVVPSRTPYSLQPSPSPGAVRGISPPPMVSDRTGAPRSLDRTSQQLDQAQQTPKRPTRPVCPDTVACLFSRASEASHRVALARGVRILRWRSAGAGWYLVTLPAGDSGFVRSADLAKLKLPPPPASGNFIVP
jgi:hypothetical protein